MDEIYINEAKRIRKEYLDNLVYITKEEENIKSLSSELKDISDSVEKSDKKSETYYKDALYEVERLITKASDKIIPYHEKIKQLDKQQRELYKTIKDKYPNMTDEEMQNIIIPHIVKVDEEYSKKYKNLLK